MHIPVPEINDAWYAAGGQDAQDAIEKLIPECEFSVCAIKMLPQEYVKLEDPHDKELWQRLLDNLDEVEDVQAVYHNVEM